MKRLVAAVAVLSLALPALALEPPPPPPDDARPEVSASYYESCFGVPRPGTGRFGVFVDQPIPIGGNSGGGGISAPSVSGGSSDKAWLIVAVVAAMALPVVVYAMDTPAPRIVLQRFACPTFSLDVYGGADSGHAASAGGSYGFVTSRFTFGVGNLATDFQLDAASQTVSAFSTHLLLRPTPRAHIEGGLALGYRRLILDGRVEEGFEIGVPHRYALWREGLSTFALELRPFLLLGARLEPSFEAAFLIPLAQVLQLRVGGRVYTFAGDLFYGLSAGLSLTL